MMNIQVITVVNLVIKCHFSSDGLFNLERKARENKSRLWTPGQEFSPYSTPSTVMESGTTTGIRVHNIRLDGSNMLFDVEYITEPSKKLLLLL